jgi:hypothetical protein
MISSVFRVIVNPDCTLEAVSKPSAYITNKLVNYVIYGTKLKETMLVNN